MDETTLPHRAMTVAEVAAFFQVDKQTVYRWIKSGRLPAAKPGQAWQIPPAAVVAMIQNRVT